MQLLSLQSLVATGDSFAPLFLRVALGVMMFPHGAQKLFGWFGGYGFTGSMGYFTGTVGTRTDTDGGGTALDLLPLTAELEELGEGRAIGSNPVGSAQPIEGLPP